MVIHKVATPSAGEGIKKMGINYYIIFGLLAVALFIGILGLIGGSRDNGQT